MINADLPTFIDAGHQHTIYGLGNLSSGTLVQGGQLVGNIGALNQQAQDWSPADYRAQAQPKPKPQQKESRMTRRLVQVFIADTDESVPLENSLLYSGEQKLTDATDQELFFEIDIKTMLRAHNEVRTKLVNKKIKERVEHLEPARIRDLKMVVVNVASF